MMLAVAACITNLCLAAFQQALNGQATWTMERHLPTRPQPLVSSGSVSCVAGSGIVWRVEAPFASEVAMTRTEMVFTDEEGVRCRPLSEMPYYEEIRNRTDAFVAGDLGAFDGLFEVSATTNSLGGWQMSLVPQVSAMRTLFTAIEVSGNACPTNVLLKSEDGGFSSIRFKERKK